MTVWVGCCLRLEPPGRRFVLSAFVLHGCLSFRQSLRIASLITIISQVTNLEI